MFFKSKRWKKIIHIKKKEVFLKNYPLYNILYLYILKNIQINMAAFQTFYVILFFKMCDYVYKSVIPHPMNMLR